MNKRLICLCITIFMLFSFVFPLGGYAEEDYFEFIEEEYDEAYIDDYYIDDTFEDESFDTENYADQELWYEDPEAEYSFDTIFEEENIDLNEFGDNLDAAALDSDSEICFNEELFILGETESFATGGPLAIETQPVNWTGVETAFASFTVVAKGGTAPYSYQWQYKNARGVWYDRGGATEETFSISAKGRDGYTVHCVVTDAAGASVTSDDVQIVITASELAIETQPVNWEGPETGTASFTVVAKDGTAPYSYQWQYKNARGVWYDRGGATEATFSIPAKGRDGYTVHCVVTDAAGASVTSDDVQIVITAPQDIVIDGVHYRITSASTVEIESYEGNATSLYIPKSVEEVYTVTAIGAEAFMEKDIASISLPNSIEVIGIRAFKGCSNLSTMTTHD